MKNKPLVSIVLLTWNGEKYIESCIEGVYNQDYENIEIVIVDNNSSSIEMKEYLENILKKDPKINLILNTHNFGFAKGMNIGIENSQGEYVLLLNQDVVLHETFISQGVKILDSKEEYAGVSGIEKLWKNGKILSEEVKKDGGGIFLRKRIQGVGVEEFSEKEVFGLNGSFPLIRKKALEELKEKTGDFYDENFGTGWEDTDLWFRMRLIGYRFLFSPKLIAWHVGSGSADEQTKLIDKNIEYQRRIFRNRVYVIIKNVHGGLKKKLLPSIITAELLIPIYYFFRSPKSLISYVKGYCDVINNYKVLLEKRNRIKKSIAIDEKDLYKFFIKF